MATKPQGSSRLHLQDTWSPVHEPRALRLTALALYSTGSSGSGLELENVSPAATAEQWESEPQFTKHRYQAGLGRGLASAAGHRLPWLVQRRGAGCGKSLAPEESGERGPGLPQAACEGARERCSPLIPGSWLHSFTT